VDSTTLLDSPRTKFRVGEYVDAIVSDVAGADLVAQPL